MASTTQQVGGAVGLAVLVAIANAPTAGVTGPALRAATTDELRAAASPQWLFQTMGADRTSGYFRSA
ncbi:hypothetical protein [Actinomadura algeriensis]|uniref:Uncharacterized protein n=1 Tax=Actinomadura algeriensis TaxID=1679523 RepID=A0ABR9K2A5_9ACTN|nr:hypothetical protein [Actinomadura algeriensis]MBE1536994.1 hypothetical protein [Actinomadura algeriensis]